MNVLKPKVTIMFIPSKPICNHIGVYPCNAYRNTLRNPKNGFESLFCAVSSRSFPYSTMNSGTNKNSDVQEKLSFEMSIEILCKQYWSLCHDEISHKVFIHACLRYGVHCRKFSRIRGNIFTFTGRKLWFTVLIFDLLWKCCLINGIGLSFESQYR